MRLRTKGVSGMLAVGLVSLTLMAGRGYADADEPNPAFETSAIVHGAGFQIRQHLVGNDPTSTTVVTKLTVINPGPSQNGNPGPPSLKIKVTSPTHGIAHAAGFLLALGLGQGIPLSTMQAVFQQLQWDVRIDAPPATAPIITPDVASSLSNLIVGALASGGIPGGGCDNASAYFQVGAAPFNLPARCGATPSPNNLP